MSLPRPEHPKVNHIWRSHATIYVALLSRVECHLLVAIAKSTHEWNLPARRIQAISKWLSRLSENRIREYFKRVEAEVSFSDLYRACSLSKLFQSDQ